MGKWPLVPSELEKRARERSREIFWSLKSYLQAIGVENIHIKFFIKYITFIKYPLQM
jgi:hypothetical protein